MDADLMENVRQNEKFYRMKAEVSAKQIGEITGHCESWIIMFEHGAIKTLGEQDIKKITKALGIRIKDLLQPAGSPVLSVTDAERRRGMENLEKIRKHKGLTVSEFNARLGLYRGRLQKALNGYGDFGVKTWLYIADVLHMDVKILIGRE